MTLWLIAGLVSIGVAFVVVIAFASCVAAGREDDARGYR